jgi:hypothetical protein
MANQWIIAGYLKYCQFLKDVAEKETNGKETKK